jgi:subtilisin family serine protease
MTAAASRRTRIGIIDSGVHVGHPHIGNIAGGISIAARQYDVSYVDRLGHGTAVAALIHHRAPQAELFVVKVFHQALVTDIETLLSAIDWCLDRDLDLINLSLGTTNENHRAAFEASVASVQAKGKVIISAAEMESLPALPGSLPNVIGVLPDPAMQAGELGAKIFNGKSVFTASPYPREIPGVPRERNLHGVSFAVSHVTASLANLWNPGAANDPESLLLRLNVSPRRASLTAP